MLRQARISNRRFSPLDRRPAFTLMELLVVIMILLTITAATIPVMSPAMGNRRMREAARVLSSYLAGARAKAIETGRPVGVVFEKSAAGGPLFCTNLSYVEVAPPYAGDFTESRIGVLPTGRIADFSGAGSGWIGQLRQGDFIQLDGLGRLYQLMSGEPYIDQNGNGQFDSGELYIDDPVNLDGNYTPSQVSLNDGYFQTPCPDGTSTTSEVRWWLVNTRESMQALPWLPSPSDPSQNQVQLMPSLAPPSPGQPFKHYTFKVFRQPVRSASPALQLPVGVVVDLELSGTTPIAATATQMSDLFSYQPTVMFSPTGRVDSIYHGAERITPTGPIFFLMGRRELMRDVNENGYLVANLYELSNLWVAVGHQTGQVTTSENTRFADYDLDGVEENPNSDYNRDEGLNSNNVAETNTSQIMTNLVHDLPIARYFARTAQGMGGK